MKTAKRTAVLTALSAEITACQNQHSDDCECWLDSLEKATSDAYDVIETERAEEKEAHGIPWNK
jgi:hypothetical protein